MRTTWRVKRVTETEGKTEAELIRVEWFKKNPAYTEGMALADEWIDAEPGEADAEMVQPGHDALTMDITDGPPLHAGDNVFLIVEHATERTGSWT
jgi:hypothetical protein